VNTTYILVTIVVHHFLASLHSKSCLRPLTLILCSMFIQEKVLIWFLLLLVVTPSMNESNYRTRSRSICIVLWELWTSSLSLMVLCQFMIFTISTVQLGNGEIISYIHGSSTLLQSKLLKLWCFMKTACIDVREDLQERTFLQGRSYSHC
jgi:hypothetical protein